MGLVTAMAAAWPEDETVNVTGCHTLMRPAGSRAIPRRWWTPEVFILAHGIVLAAIARMPHQEPVPEIPPGSVVALVFETPSPPQGEANAWRHASGRRNVPVIFRLVE